MLHIRQCQGFVESVLWFHYVHICDFSNRMGGRRLDIWPSWAGGYEFVAEAGVRHQITYVGRVQSVCKRSRRVQDSHR